MSKPNSSSKVLYSEMNEQVLSSGAKELQKAGFNVQTAVGRKAVQEALNTSKFDLVILGGTLSRDDRHHLPYMAKKADQSIKVVVMHTDGSRHPYVDGNIDTGEDMEHLLRKISAVQQLKVAAAAAGR
jgi:DNA-binding NtrC family response regulator